MRRNERRGLRPNAKGCSNTSSFAALRTFNNAIVSYVANVLILCGSLQSPLFASLCRSSPGFVAGLFGPGGRFSGSVDPVMEKFNASIGFDKRMWEEDINGSISYAKSLVQMGVVTSAESEQLIEGLGKVKEEVRASEERSTELRRRLHTTSMGAVIPNSLCIPLLRHVLLILAGRSGLPTPSS